MKTIGIICKKDSPEAASILEELLPWLMDKGLEVHMEKTQIGARAGVITGTLKKMAATVDVILVLGGDGTMLYVARNVAAKDVPLIGVNLGSLGFITEVHKDEIFQSIDRTLTGCYTSESRMMLNAMLVRKGEKVTEFTALNDIVVTKGELGKLIDLETYVNGVYVNLFKGDGLITSTPTGSTAYSLSANGPILYPTMHAILLTPICPHILTNRPVVLPEDIQLEIKLKSSDSGIILMHDGVKAAPLKQGDTVVITKSPHTTTILMTCDRDHFQVLREKLSWGER